MRTMISKTFTEAEIRTMSIEDLCIIEASLAMTIDWLTINKRPVSAKMSEDLARLSPLIDERVKDDKRRQLGVLELSRRQHLSREVKLAETDKQIAALKAELGVIETPESAEARPMAAESV